MPEPTDASDPLRQRQAGAYQRGRRRLEALGAVLSAGLVVAGALLGHRLASAFSTPGPLVVDAAAYVLGVGIVVQLAELPLAVIAHRRARRAGLSRQGLASWLADHAKGWALAFALAWPAVWALLWLQREWPHGWWLPAAAAAVAVEVVLATLAPVVILPLFFRSRPLPAGPLADDLLQLARAARVRVSSVRVLEAGAKTSVANAFVAGLGPSRRIMLYDTLVGEGELDPARFAETRTVLAHELGHHRAGDIWRFLALGAATTALSFGLAAAALPHLPGALLHGGVGTLSALPALALLLGLIGAPLGVLGRAYSRRRERAADAFATRVGGDGEAFASALEQLCAQNLAELRPPPLYVALRGSHPPPAERIAMARGKETRARRRRGVT